MASNGSSKEGRALLELGKRAIGAIRDGSVDALDVIDSYVQGFSKWEATWKTSEAGGKVIPAVEQQLAKRLANQHAQIIRLTGEMQAHFVESLKGLRTKERGLKRYIDQLPQRISSINKKG
ncbi:MAG: hypothetical protein RL518_1046 [Pseudomonadota bacterium]|jgi:hypothetical protein